jgi:hypothetical protein
MRAERSEEDIAARFNTRRPLRDGENIHRDLFPRRRAGACARRHAVAQEQDVRLPSSTPRRSESLNVARTGFPTGALLQ